MNDIIKIINLNNVIPILLFISIAILPVITIILTILAFGYPVSSNIIKYKDRNIIINVDNKENLTDKIFKYNIDELNIVDIELIDFIGKTKEKGFLYNYEFSIIEQLKND